MVTVLDSCRKCLTWANIKRHWFRIDNTRWSIKVHFHIMVISSLCLVSSIINLTTLKIACYARSHLASTSVSVTAPKRFLNQQTDIRRSVCLMRSKLENTNLVRKSNISNTYPDIKQKMLFEN